MDPAVFNVILSDARDGRCPGNFTNEGERSENHADFHRESEIRHDGESQCFFPVAHVVRNHEQNSGQCGQGHVFDEWRGENQNCEKGEGVNHARDGRFCARTDVCCCASDGAGRRQAPEQWR